MGEDEMNLYYIDAGEIRFYSKKIEAEKAAKEEADKLRVPVNISKMFIAIDRDNISRMANKMSGFTKFVGKVATIAPRKRPHLKLRKLAVASVVSLVLLLPNLSEAATSCTTRKSGSVTITTCTEKNSFTQCRSYRSGSVVKTSCRT
jgi:hypothetical protein